MKYKNEAIVIFLVTAIILFLKYMNILQLENGLGKPLVLILIILFFCVFAIKVQKK